MKSNLMNCVSDTKSLFLELALLRVGLPYIWGGKGYPGLDCSGLVVECLKAVGMIQNGVDMSAQALHDYYSSIHKGSVVTEAEPAALVFFGKSKKEVTHVGICLSGKYMVEAGGGDSTCKTPEDAAKKGDAMVRIRPISVRRDLQAIVMPKY